VNDRTQEQARFMDMALDEARAAAAAGNLAVGSVIVRGGQVIGRGRNLVRTSGDPTAHAEIVAIRDASRGLGTPDLPGSTCYTTMEPCPMCCWALVIAGIERVVLGARHVDVGNTTVGDYTLERLLSMTRREMALSTGIAVDECLSVEASGR
jgi:tRNA(Arg) A34 adenosine deaminase TadA